MNHDLEYRIARLQLKQGDILVFKFNRTLEAGENSIIRDSLMHLIPDGVRILVIDDQVDLSVLTADEIATRTKS